MLTPKKVARAGTLMVALLAFGTVPSEATSITHNFSSTNLVHDYNFVPIDEDEDEVIDGYLYTFRVGFDTIHEAFNLTITNVLITWDGPDVTSVLGAGFKCVQITTTGKCVDFLATSSDPGGLPQAGVDNQFSGPITVAIRYAPFGWPLTGPDPIDIGRTDDFSSFMLYASQAPDPGPPAFDDTYRIVHFATNASAPIPTFKPITHVAHCGGSDINACAQANGLTNFIVPEPATLFGVISGVLGLTVLRRRQQRRA